MARIWDETFEAAGTDESYTGTNVGAGASIEPDFDTGSVTNAPSSWADECAEFVVVGGQDCSYRADFASAEAIAYWRYELIVSSHSLTTGQANLLGIGYAPSFALELFRVSLVNNAGTTVIRWQVNHNAAGGTTGDVTFATDTLYVVEIQWDSTNDVWAVRVNESEEGSGSLTSTAATSTAQIFFIGGNAGGQNNAMTVYFDNVAVDDTDWIGPEPGGGGPPGFSTLTIIYS